MPGAGMLIAAGCITRRKCLILLRLTRGAN